MYLFDSDNAKTCGLKSVVHNSDLSKFGLNLSNTLSVMKRQNNQNTGLHKHRALDIPSCQVFSVLCSKNLQVAFVKTISIGLMTTAATLAILLPGCNSSDFGQTSSWQTYRNPRYDFEFLYPEGWMPAAMPANEDGQAFIEPDNPAIEMRGWGSQIPLANGSNQEKLGEDLDMEQNFVTEQGLSGHLEVEISSETSSMTLALQHENVIYYWQGRSPSDQFAEYYRLFDYVARQYRVLPDEGFQRSLDPLGMNVR
jgi:hypothetical protein